MIENWIDVLAKLWEFDDGRGKQVKSYHLFDKAEFPESINEFPCAITYPTSLAPQYSTAGPTILLWEGTTEFHLAGNVALSNIPYVLPFFKRILTAAAGSMTLGSQVAWFEIPNEPGSISLVEFEFGSGPQHRGILVRWKVKENVTGQIIVDENRLVVYPYLLLATGQLTQYSGELDDGYYEKGIIKSSYTIKTTGQYSGTVNVDLPHLISDTGAFTAANQTYADAGKCGVFKPAGGETVVVTGSVSNNGTFTTVSATADSVVFTAGIVNEADAPMTTFAKREAISNACVVDNNTGLMWLRTNAVKMGVAGNGKMPWTGQLYDIFAFCAACNAVGVGGYSDWRIPNDLELSSLRDMEAPTAAPNAVAFPSWRLDDYIWSATTLPYSTSNAMVVHFYSGGIVSNTKVTPYYVALLRGS